MSTEDRGPSAECPHPLPASEGITGDWRLTTDNSPSIRRALIIVGKPPIPGRVKTRLCPPLTPATAAALYTAFLRDTVALAQAVAGTEVAVLYPPMPDGMAVLIEAVGPAVRLLAQRGEGLGDALAGAAADLLGDGYQQVALVSSDNPNLPPAYVAAAFDALAQHDVALGPAEDGGYYLIALRQPHLGLFEGITWSTPVVLAQTLARAAALSLTVATTPCWYDVDDLAGLRRLQTDLATAADEIARYTRATLYEVMSNE